MKLIETPIPGVRIVELEPALDERGFFARTWCAREAEEHGLNPHVAQCSVSFNRQKGTVRGMHYQSAPGQEAKLVRCTRGAIHDVVVDVRPDSGTFRRAWGVDLAAERALMLYIPEGVAHGFQTLRDETEVFYQISEFYQPEAQRGFRWDDPAFAIAWPQAVTCISARDMSYPDFR